MGWTLVTGGAKRLGAEICLFLAQVGYDIIVHYNKSEIEARSVVEACIKLGVNAAMIQGDFSTKDLLDDFIVRYLKEFSNTKCLINNVGNYVIKSSMHTGDIEWLDLFQTNLHTPFFLSKALIPSIIAEKGSIVNIGTSGLQSSHANIQCTAYTITKSGLMMLTKSLAKELATHDVRVNMVSPGYLEIAVDLPKDVSKLPMHRAASCAEVCRVISFLLDPHSSYITGQNIEVAGGIGLS